MSEEKPIYDTGQEEYEFTRLDWHDRDIAGFRVNIVGVGLKPADQFKAHPRNPKYHPQRQRAAVKTSLGKWGWAGFVLENRLTQNVLDGHERIWNALKQGESTLIPYALIEIPEEEEEEFIIALAQTEQMAEWDRDILRAIKESGVIEEAEEEFDILGLLKEQGIEIDDNDNAHEHLRLIDRFIVPPFSVLDARQGYWQERKRQWIALGIQSELGRGEGSAPGGSLRPAANYEGDRGDGRGRTLGAIPSNQQTRLSADYKKKRGGVTKMAMHNDPMQRKDKYDA
jgi:hypothetical protein